MELLLMKAIHFAAFKHRNQRRKCAERTPYINHPLELLNVLVTEGGVQDVNVLCAAVLHDTVEDTDTHYEELVDLFGKKIADIVMEVTDDKALPKQERKDRQIAHAASLSDEAKLVLIADKISNVRDIGDYPPHTWSVERLDKYLDWSGKVFDGVRGIHPELEIIFDRVHAQSLEKISNNV